MSGEFSDQRAKPNKSEPKRIEKREPGTVTFSLFRSQFFANSEAKQSKTYPLCTTSTRRSYICSGLITKS